LIGWLKEGEGKGQRADDRRPPPSPRLRRGKEDKGQKAGWVMRKLENWEISQTDELLTVYYLTDCNSLHYEGTKKLQTFLKSG